MTKLDRPGGVIDDAASVTAIVKAAMAGTQDARLKEIVDALIEHGARGLTIVNDFFSAATARDQGPFDVIALSMVLEHVKDPIGLINEARSTLSPALIDFDLNFSISFNIFHC